MNFGNWKIKVNDKDQLEFHHKNLNTNEFEIVKKYKAPIKHKLKKKIKHKKLVIKPLKIKKLKSKKDKKDKKEDIFEPRD